MLFLIVFLGVWGALLAFNPSYELRHQASRNMLALERIQKLCQLWWEEGNKFVRVRVSTRTIKTIKKLGLNATAKKFGIDLNKFALSSGTAPETAKV